MTLSLEKFHLVFLLAAMIAADMFGAWAIWHYPVTHDGLSLALGIVALLGGLALAGYALFFDRWAERNGVA